MGSGSKKKKLGDPSVNTGGPSAPGTLSFNSDSDNSAPDVPVSAPHPLSSGSSSREKKKKWRKRDFKELNERTVELECELDELKSAHDDDMKAKDKQIEKWKNKYENQLNKKKQAQQRYRRLKRRWEGGIFIPGKKSGPKPASLIGLSPRQIKRRRIAFSKDVTETVARIGLRHNMNLSDISIYMYGVKLIMPTELQLQNVDRLRAESDEENNRNKFSDTSSDDDSDDDVKGPLGLGEKKHRPPLAPSRRKHMPPPPPEFPPPPPHHPPPPPPPGTTIAPLYGMHVNNAQVGVQESAQVLDFDAFEPQGPPPLSIKPLPTLPSFPQMTPAPENHNGPPGAPETQSAPTTYAQVQSAPTIYATAQTFSGQHTLVALQAGQGLPHLSAATNTLQMSGPHPNTFPKFTPFPATTLQTASSAMVSVVPTPQCSVQEGNIHSSVMVPQPIPVSSTGTQAAPQSVVPAQIVKPLQPNGRPVTQVY